MKTLTANQYTRMLLVIAMFIGISISALPAQTLAQSALLETLQAHEVWLAPYFKANPDAAYRVVRNQDERNMAFARPGDITLVGTTPQNRTWWRLTEDRRWVKMEKSDVRE